MSSKPAKTGTFANQPVRYKTVGEAASGLFMSIDYEYAPVPTHYYLADYFQVVPLEMEVLLIFGKLDHPHTGRLRNKIEIYFPADMFVMQLWKTSRDFQKTLEELVAKTDTQAAQPGAFAPETDKVQTLQANNVLMVLATTQTLMDFFYISVKDLWMRPKRHEPIGMEALVRVICNPQMVLGFLHEADKVAQVFTERFQFLKEQQNETLEFK